MSCKPSLLISIILTPRHQTFVLMPALSVTSSNLKFPLLIYSLDDDWLPQKNKSCKPSLLKSPAATPAPMYIYSLVKKFTESLSVTLLLKLICVMLLLNNENPRPFTDEAFFELQADTNQINNAT